VELKSKLRELNKLLAATLAEKQALQKQLDNTDSQQSHPTLNDSIGIPDSSAKKSAAKQKKKKTS